MIHATRTEPGCILYDLNVSITDPQSMISVEAWKDREALTEHFETPHMTIWRKASAGYFENKKVKVVHPEKGGDNIALLKVNSNLGRGTWAGKPA